MRNTFVAMEMLLTVESFSESTVQCATTPLELVVH